MKTHSQTNTNFIEFNSIIDLLNYTDCDYDSLYNSSRKGSFEFTESKNWDDFLSIAKNGDKKLMSIAQISTQKELKIFESLDDKFNYSQGVEGLFFDIGMLMNGEPEHWLKNEYNDDKTQIEIKIECGYSSQKKAEDVIQNAARLIAFIKLLESRNVQIRLTAVFTSKDVNERKNKNLCISLQIKDYEHNFDYAKISSIFHPSFFRRGIFAVIEKFQGLDMSSNYGIQNTDKDTFFIYDKESIDKLINGVLK